MEEDVSPNNHLDQPIVAIKWRDAAYSYQEDLPESTPPPQLTFGLVLEKSDEYINICSNLYLEEVGRGIEPSDGIVIPRDSIISMTEIGRYE